MTAVPDVPLRQRPSRARFDVVVVGTGVGACVAAAHLARAGRRVLVVEKNASVGGALASYRREGFKLDLGSHLVARGERGALGRALGALGLERPRFTAHAIPVRSRGLLELTAPARRGGLLEVAVEAVAKLHVPGREAARLARLTLELLTLTEQQLERWDRRTLEAFLLERTEHPGAYLLFGFLASVFFVLPPWEVSAGEALRALRQVLRDYRLAYVEGGMDRVAHALLGCVVEAGGEVVVEREVRGLHPGLAVELADGTLCAAPVVVFGGEPPRLLELGRDLELPRTYLERLRGLRGSGNAQQLKLGLSRPVFSEGCMIGALSPSGLGLAELDLGLMRRTVEAIADGRLSDPLVIYAPVPSNHDPAVAPPGCQLVAASVYGPSQVAPRDPPERWREVVLGALTRAVPGLEGALLFAELSPVRSLAAWMGRPSGAAIANGQRPGEVGRDRLSVVTPVPGLFLAGDGAGGRGIGVELAAASGLEAAGAILRGEPQAWGEGVVSGEPRGAPRP